MTADSAYDAKPIRNTCAEAQFILLVALLTSVGISIYISTGLCIDGLLSALLPSSIVIEVSKFAGPKLNLLFLLFALLLVLFSFLKWE